MREHMGLFRGKRKGKGEWVEGGLYDHKDPAGGVWFIVRTDLDGSEKALATEFILVDPDTVGECTGLTDKNGKLIFEGDIIEQVYLGVKHRFTIVYSQVAFAWGQKNKDGLTGRLAKGIGTLEIIGNIYDNPELLEGAGEKK